MEKEIKMRLGDNPAFPLNDLQARSIEELNKGSVDGMSKRFYAACAAMQGILSNDATLKGAANSGLSNKEKVSVIINQSYIFADELLKYE